MGTDHPVYFAGPWPDDERILIERTARQTEYDQPFDPAVAMLGCPWACCRIAQAGQARYLAHWSRRPGLVLRAPSATALARQMRAVY